MSTYGLTEADRDVRRLLYAAPTDILTALGYVVAAMNAMPDDDLKRVISEAGPAVRDAGRRHAEALTVYLSSLAALAWAEATRRGIDPRGLAGQPDVGGYL